jgi:hypothetical protein
VLAAHFRRQARLALKWPAHPQLKRVALGTVPVRWLTRAPVSLLLSLSIIAVACARRPSLEGQSAATPLTRRRPAPNPAACAREPRIASSDSSFIFPPQPTAVIVPSYEVATALRGRTLTIRFLVGVAGVVDSLEILAPPNTNRVALSQLRNQMRRYRFDPALTLDGCPVQSWFPVQLRL